MIELHDKTCIVVRRFAKVPTSKKIVNPVCEEHNERQRQQKNTGDKLHCEKANHGEKRKDDRCNVPNPPPNTTNAMLRTVTRECLYEVVRRKYELRLDFAKFAGQVFPRVAKDRGGWFVRIHNRRS